MSGGRFALGLVAALATTVAAARPPPPDPLCDPLVRPELLAQHSGRNWLQGPGIRLKDDIIACAYYQKQPPAALALSVRNDGPQYEFKAALATHAGELQPAPGLGEEAFYFRHDGGEPFVPSWGLVVRAQRKTFRLEGMPEAEQPEAARALARQIVERALERFGGR